MANFPPAKNPYLFSILAFSCDAQEQHRQQNYRCVIRRPDFFHWAPLTEETISGSFPPNEHWCIADGCRRHAAEEEARQQTNVALCNVPIPSNDFVDSCKHNISKDHCPQPKCQVLFQVECVFFLCFQIIAVREWKIIQMWKPLRNLLAQTKMKHLYFPTFLPLPVFLQQ